MLQHARQQCIMWKIVGYFYKGDIFGGVREKIEARGGSYNAYSVERVQLISAGECNDIPHSKTKRIGSKNSSNYA